MTRPLVPGGPDARRNGFSNSIPWTLIFSDGFMRSSGLHSERGEGFDRAREVGAVARCERQALREQRLRLVGPAHSIHAESAEEVVVRVAVGVGAVGPLLLRVVRVPLELRGVRMVAVLEGLVGSVDRGAIRAHPLEDRGFLREVVGEA